MGNRQRQLFHQIRGATLAVMILMGGAAITSCGGVEGGEAFLEGIFMDDAVSGLSYKTESTAGQTDENGVFKYKGGEEITFFIGDIVLGTAKGKTLISPLDLSPGAEDVDDSKVTNIALLLQTLDHDGYLNNGIQIPLGIEPVVAESIALNGPLDLEQEPDVFAQDRPLTGLLEELNTVQKFAENIAGALRQPVTPEDARQHLKANFSDRKSAVTAYGKVKGFSVDNDTWNWLGIPYAKPPLGNLRWRVPQPPDPWAGFMDTTAHSLPCTQQIHSTTWQPSPYYKGSEDCLYLDVYRPKTDDNNLPVYVWIHGGINNFGGAQDYDGAPLAKKGNMVVVVIQYRLGALGWLTHPALRDEEAPKDGSGNYGTLDHIHALEWVKGNIAAFGGDPNNVTVGGQSGGAHNTLNLMLSPKAKGLFRKAVVQSASMEYRTIEKGDTEAELMMNWLLVDDESAENNDGASKVRAQMTNKEVKNYLRSKAASKIINACRIGVNNGMIPANSAFSDGLVLPKKGLIESIAEGSYNKVPILIGTNEDDFKDIMPLYGELLNNRFPTVPSGKYTWASLYLVLDGNLSLDKVFPTDRDKEFYDVVGTLKSRIWKAKYLDSIARALKTNAPENPVFAYRFDWSGGGDSILTDFDFIFGAACGMEIPFFFGSSQDTFRLSFTSSNESGRTALQEAMMTYLATFIAGGDPNPKDSNLLEWPQWSNKDGDPKFITLDAGLTSLELSVSSEEETLRAIFTDVKAERLKFNKTGELGYMDALGLALPEK